MEKLLKFEEEINFFNWIDFIYLYIYNLYFDYYINIKILNYCESRLCIVSENLVYLSISDDIVKRNNKFGNKIG